MPDSRILMDRTAHPCSSRGAAFKVVPPTGLITITIITMITIIRGAGPGPRNIANTPAAHPNSSITSLSLSLHVYVYMYIYIYIYTYRDRNL